MTDEQKKKPGAAFYATIVVVLVLAYPLSFGPACWITSRTNVGADLVPVVYRPLMWAMSPVDETAATRLIEWYAGIGAPAEWEWVRLWDGETGRHIGWRWEPVGPYAITAPLPPLPAPPSTSPPLSDEPGEWLYSPKVRGSIVWDE